MKSLEDMSDDEVSDLIDVIYERLKGILPRDARMILVIGTLERYRACCGSFPLPFIPDYLRFAANDVEQQLVQRN